MEEKLPEMPFLRNVGLLVTYKCQVTCPHCIIAAGPHRSEEMLLDDAFDWIRQIADYRNSFIKVLSLTGGEPFYNFDTLKKLVEFASGCGLFVSVVTNAFWATSRKAALSVIEDFPEIKLFSISTDVYHQRSIPFERVKNAILAARECEVPYSVAVCTENEEEVEYKEILNKLTEITERETITTAVTFPAGRALSKIGTLKHRMTREPPLSACSAGSSPIVFPDGRVIACIGPVIDLTNSHPLVLGNLRENSLEEILDKAETNTTLHAIRVWGPRKLIGMIREAGLGRHLPDEYIRNSTCNACYRLMSSDEIVGFLDELSEDQEFRQKVAYARVYYLNEAQMMEFEKANIINVK